MRAILESTFVCEEFKYAVNNNMREYLEFDDKENLKQEMKKAMEKRDKKEKIYKKRKLK